MRIVWALALCVSLASCAGLRRPGSEVCQPSYNYEKGSADAEAHLPLDLSHLQACAQEERAALTSQYHLGYKAVARPVKSTSSPKLGGDEVRVRVAAVAPGNAWMCEVELHNKIFTGFGRSQPEASRQAQAACGAHFQISFCTEMECREGL